MKIHCCLLDIAALFGPVQLALCIPPKPDSSIRLPYSELWFITPESTFLLLQIPMAVCYRPLQPMLGIAHGGLRLVYGCSTIETHFMALLTNSSCADVIFRGSLETCNECCVWGRMVFTLYMLQHPADSSCEILWPTASWLSYCFS